VLEPIVLKWIGGAAPWSLVAPLTHEDGPNQICVPIGFKTDLASVPRLFWALIPPHGRYIRAAIIHDYLYIHKPVSRSIADRIFLDLMRRDGVPRWKRWIMYSAVRLGGWKGWLGYGKAE